MWRNLWGYLEIWKKHVDYISWSNQKWAYLKELYLYVCEKNYFLTTYFLYLLTSM